MQHARGRLHGHCGLSPVDSAAVRAGRAARPARIRARGDVIRRSTRPRLTPAAWQTAPTRSRSRAPTPAPGSTRCSGGSTGRPRPTPLNGETVTISTSGVHTFETRAIDLDGNFSLLARRRRSGSTTILPIDSTDPGTAGLAAGRHQRRCSSPPTRRPASTTSSGSSTAARSTSGANGAIVPIAGDGAHVFRTRAVDVAGNVSVWIDHTVRVDTVTPTDTTAAPGGWQTGPLKVSVAGSDAHSGVATLTWQARRRRDQHRPAAGHRHRVRRWRAPPRDARHRRRRPRRAAGRATRSGSTARRPRTRRRVASSAWRATDYAVMVSGADDGSGLARGRVAGRRRPRHLRRLAAAGDRLRHAARTRSRRARSTSPATPRGGARSPCESTRSPPTNTTTSPSRPGRQPVHRLGDRQRRALRHQPRASGGSTAA